MKPHERLYVDAVQFIEGGNDSLKDLVDHLLAESVLEEVAEEWGLDPGDVLLDILTKPGEYRVSEEHDLVIGTDVFLEGMTLTHRLTEDELHEDLLEATPDLILLFDNGDPALVSGGSLALRYPSKGDGQFRHGSVGGPPGWLDGFSAGDLVVFALGADGARVEEAGEVGDGAAEQAALLAEFESRAVGLPGTGFDATNIVDEAMLGHPDLFRSPVPPISELLDAAGLDLDGAWVGRPGDDWEPLHLRVSVLKARIDAERRGFSPCCVSELETAVGFAMGRNIPARDANAALSHGGTALAFQDWWMGLWSLAGDQFAELLVDLVGGGGELAGARYLAAIHHDARGEAVAAEGQLDRVLLDYPEYHPALDMAAGYASDRGDLRRAISLWTRADADPDEGSLPLHRDLEIPFPSVGRNDPCPCGSGRKYKVCHLDKPMVSDDRRVSWMFDKVFRYRSAHHRHDRVAALVADAMGDEIDDDEMIRLWGAEFVNDIAIFEDGLFEGFIAERSDLLPEDELAIFRLWVGERLRCWEVTATDGERWLTFRDTATDDTVEVHDRASASSMVPGDQILTRIFPAFGVHWLPPVGLRVDLRRRDEILELLDDYPPATVWIQWYQSLLAPPTLTTSEGDPFIYTTATLRPATNWDDLEPLLDATFERDGDTWTYLGHNEGPGSLIRGSLQREGDLLEIYTFSSERMDTILAMLDRHVVLVERTERAMAELEPTEGYQPEEVELSADDRAEIIEGMENKWLKESVPALGGLTPREAALDPTRREDLIALLRDFDRMTPPGSAMTFDVDSLRRKLDLD